MTRRLDCTLPQPTLAQRCASLSDAQLLGAEQGLSSRTDAASVEALAVVRAELAKRGIAH